MSIINFKKSNVMMNFIITIIIIALISIPTTNLYATVCNYLVGGTWQGELDHCYSVTFGTGVQYERSYCVYTATERHGIEFEGTKEIPYEQANQC